MTDVIEIPNRIFIRIYLHYGGLYRKLCWFEMKDGDLYWGSSSNKVKSMGTQDFRFGKPVYVPPLTDDLPEVHSKYSYHRSGVVHSKEQEGSKPPIYDPYFTWKRKEDIKQLTSFYILITGIIKNYKSGSLKPKYNVKRNEYCLTIGCEDSEQFLSKRMYMEFFLGPIGLHPLPKATLIGRQLVNNICHIIAPNLQLMMIYEPTGMFEDRWPEVEMSMVPSTLK